MTVSKHVTGFIAAFSLMACDSEMELKNGFPRVTWVTSTLSERFGPEVSEFTLWVQDPEGDPVDVRITWGESAQSLKLAPGSAPSLGLPTQLGLNSSNGQAHTLLWDLNEVPDSTLELTFWLNDRPREDDSEEVGFKVSLNPRDAAEPVAVTPL